MFDFADKRILYVIIAIFIVMNIGEYLNNPDSLLNLVLSLPAVLIAITFHEFAHAYAADKLGDDTPRRQGRLNLNPLSHLDPIGSVMLVFAGFGWGKPVEIEPRNFNRDRSMSESEAIVSFAGPGMNFFLSVVFALLMGVYYKYLYIPYNTIHVVIYQLLGMCVVVNLGLGIFNLIPLPPLDGSKILRNFLPYKAKQWFDSNYQILYFVFILIWVTPIASRIISPLISATYNGLTDLVFKIFGIN